MNAKQHLGAVIIAGLFASGCSDAATTSAATSASGSGGSAGSSSGAGGEGAGGDGAGGEGAGGAPATTSGAGGSGDMSFFVTSEGSGVDGGNYGGLDGADARCQAHAARAGVGDRTWRAYLSTTTVDARDRIGSGPWFNLAGEMVAADVAALHASGIESPRLTDENGMPVPLNEHDIVTGTSADGQLYVSDNAQNCLDWTTSDGQYYARVGHADWSVDGEDDGDSWSSTHETPCDQEGMLGTLSTGRIYCFAVTR